MSSGNPLEVNHRRRPMLLAIGGIIASGKSTIARLASAELRAALHVADVIRDEILYRAEVSIDEAWQRTSADGFTDEVYSEMLRRARQGLAEGLAVVVDGCFGTRNLRNDVRALASEERAEFLFIECRCDRKVIERRLAERSLSTGTDPSGWLHLLDRFEEGWQPVDELSAHEHLVIDTARPFDETWSTLMARLEDFAGVVRPVAIDAPTLSPEMRRGV